MRRRIAAARGFTLVESLVAATTVLVALAGLAQLLTAAALTARRSRTLTHAAVLAQQQLETLLPQAALDATLAASPAGTLARNVTGYFEFVDSRGNVTGGEAAPPADAAYVRRWAVEALPTGSGVTLMLHVVVSDAHHAGLGAQVVGVVRQVR